MHHLTRYTPVLTLGLFFISFVVWAAVEQIRLAKPYDCREYPSMPHCLVETETAHYTSDTKYGDANGGFTCSRPIRMVTYKVSVVDGLPYDYQPADLNEASEVCTRTSYY